MKLTFLLIVRLPYPNSCFFFIKQKNVYCWVNWLDFKELLLTYLIYLLYFLNYCLFGKISSSLTFFDY